MPTSLNSRVFIATVLACLFTGWLAGTARADLTISAAPSLLEVSATPGGTGSQDITVTNGGSEPIAIQAGPAQYKGGDGDLSAVDWLKVEPAGFELAPGQRRVVKISITVPSYVNSGGRYAMVAFKTGAKASEGSGVGVAAQVGVPFLITVKGPAALAQQPSLDSLVPVLEPNGSLGFRTVVSNGGNVHFYASGTVDVTDGAGTPWGRLSLRDSTAVLPGTKELLYSDRPIAFVDGATYRAKSAVLFDGKTQQVRETEFAATAALEIEGVTPRTGPAGELGVDLQLKNSGGLGLLPRVMMAIRKADGTIAGVLSPNEQPLVWPGQTVEMQANYPGKLTPGKYALVARAEFGASSAQQETPFEISGSPANAAPAVPVSKWAKAGQQEAPVEAPSVLATIPSPIQEKPSDQTTGWPMGTMLPLVALALAAVLVVLYLRRSRPFVRPEPGGPIALLSQPAFSFRPAQLLRRRRRSSAHEFPRPLLPPPPIYLLGAPAEGSWPGRPAGQPAGSDLGASAHSLLDSSPRRQPQTLDASRPSVAWMSAIDKAGSGAQPDQRPRTTLSRAVAQKAAALVGEASKAAQRGDRAAVHRFGRQALQLDPRNVEAWLWLAATYDDAESARLCLEAVQLLDPANAKAKRALTSLDGRITGDGRSDDRWREATRDARRRDAGPVQQPIS